MCDTRRMYLCGNKYDKIPGAVTSSVCFGNYTLRLFVNRCIAPISVVDLSVNVSTFSNQAQSTKNNLCNPGAHPAGPNKYVWLERWMKGFACTCSFRSDISRDRKLIWSNWRDMGCAPRWPAGRSCPEDCVNIVLIVWPSVHLNIRGTIITHRRDWQLKARLYNWRG
jgi:hypothetical protein